VNVRRLAAASALALLGFASVAAAPVLDRARAGPCVEDPKVMRLTHMDLLKHGRDETVHGGVRDRRHALSGCVDCHASKADGKVLGSDRHFCQGCHSYAAVRLDCFECHSSQARQVAAR
jgi:[DsrC]-trisulfide reductase subunit J